MENTMEKAAAKETREMEQMEQMEEHYDGSTMDDVYGNYADSRRDVNEAYIPVNFLETRKYLQQVRDLKRSMKMVKDRIGYRRDAGLGAADLDARLSSLEDELTLVISEVADEIGKLDDVNQQVIMTMRYIDVMRWEDIAERADLRMRTVQKCHGKALPKMERILSEDGLIELAEKED